MFHCLTRQNNFIIIFVSLCLYLQYSVSLFFCMSLFCYCLPVCFCIAVSMFSSLSFVTIVLLLLPCITLFCCMCCLPSSPGSCLLHSHLSLFPFISGVSIFVTLSGVAIFPFASLLLSPFSCLFYCLMSPSFSFLFCHHRPACFIVIISCFY